MPEMSDDAWLAQYVGGTADAFTQLVDRHAAMVYRTCLRVLDGRSALAEDAAQAVFLLLARKARHLQGRPDLAAWLYRSAVLIARNLRRTEARRAARESVPPASPTPRTPAAEAEQREVRLHLDAAIAQLSTRQREAVVLHFLEGASHVDVGRRLGCSEAAVRQRLESALPRLRRYLTRHGIADAETRLSSCCAAAALATCPEGLRGILSGVGGGATSPAARLLVTQQQATAWWTWWWGMLVPLGVLGSAAVAISALHTHMLATLPPAPPVAAVAPAADGARPPPIPLSTITGVVVSADDHQVLPGFPVTAWLGAPRAGGERRPATKMPVAITDAQGRYTLRFPIDSLRLWEATVVPTEEADEMGTCTVSIYRGEAVAAEPLTVRRPDVLQARLVDDRGGPIAGASITSMASRGMRSDAQGSFTDPHYNGRRTTWAIAAPGFHLVHVTVQGPHPDPASLVIRLTPSPAVQGHVTRPDGSPATGVHIAARMQRNVGPPDALVVTDAQGGFTLTSLPAPGTPLWLVAVEGDRALCAPVAVDAPATAIQLALWPTGLIDCQVTDEPGLPVGGASLMTQRQSTDPQGWGDGLRYATTDDTGHARLIAPAGATTVHLIDAPLTHPLCLETPQPTVLVPAGGQCTCTLACTRRADAGRYVVGYLRDAQGRPLLHAQVGACVRIAEAGGVRTYRGDDYTQADGRFDIEMPYDNGDRDGLRQWEPPDPVHDGELRVVARMERSGTNFLDTSRAWNPADTPMDVGSITAARPLPERTVVVSTHAPGGQPRWCVVDRCSDASGRDVPVRYPDGAASRHDLTLRCRGEGALTLRLHDDLGHQATLTTTSSPAPQHLDVTFPPARRITVAVNDGQGHPLPHVRLVGRSLASPWSFPPEMAGSITSTAAGQITVPVATAASASWVLYQDLAHAIAQGRILPGTADLHLDAHLGPATARLAGQVVVPDTRLLPLMRVDATIRAGGVAVASETITLDAQGRFACAVPAGIDLTLTAFGQWPTGLAQGRATATTAAGTTTAVRLPCRILGAAFTRPAVRTPAPASTPPRPGF